jgi:predicted PurR-regulated permease PerM
MNHDRVLDISWGTIFKISLAILGLYIVYLTRDVLVWIIFALIISILFNPAIDFLQRRKIPRVLATILIYVGIFGILGSLLYFIIPPFVSEMKQFTQFFPQYFEKLAPPLEGLGIEAFKNFESFSNSLGDWLVGASSNIFSAVSIIFGGIFSTITIFAIAIFLSLEEKGVERFIVLLSPKRYEAYVLNLWGRSQTKVAGWFGARILSSLAVGLMTFIACKVLAIEYAVSFGILAGILDIIPIIGPIVAGIIIVVFVALDSWLNALFIFLAFLLIQQIEGNILTPVLTRKFVGLPSVLVLIALMIGGKLLGILGAILAIPLAGVIYEFLRDFLKKRKEEKTIAL